MINPFQVSYSDFQLDTIINPDEFDVNFADVAVRMNQVIDVLNQITDGVNGNGSDLIDVGDIAPFTSEKLQSFLEELVGRIRSNGFDELGNQIESGAEFIGSLPISGIEGDTVHGQIFSLNEKVESYNSSAVSRLTSLETGLSETNANLSNLDTRVSGFETDVSTLTANKADKMDVYTKTEVNDYVSSAVSDVYQNVYDILEVNDLLDEKTNLTGDHKGTWHGLSIEDLADAIYAKGMVISPTEPTTPEEGLLWFNPTNDQYTIYLNGRWRVNGTPMKIVKVENSTELLVESSSVDIGIQNFDPEFDSLLVFKNTVFAKEGRDYVLSADGTQIQHPTGTWAAGTTFDFVAQISEPVIS